MADKTTIDELLKLPVKDLRREILSQQMIVARLRITTQMQKEKNTANYVHERKQLARMKTALTKKMTDELSVPKGDSTVSALESSSSTKRKSTSRTKKS